MVRVVPKHKRNRLLHNKSLLLLRALGKGVAISFFSWIILRSLIVRPFFLHEKPPDHQQHQIHNEPIVTTPKLITKVKKGNENHGDATVVRTNDANNQIRLQDVPCGYQTWDDLIDAEAHPKEGERHIVTPPSDQGSKVSLVCCRSTAGPLAIAVHPNWATRGAERFLFLVANQYFESWVPLFRCVPGFLCQFGLSGKVGLFGQLIPNREDHNLKDDVQWLPAGPKHRKHGTTKRFAQGYMSYAGGGENTRDKQFFVALQANGPLGGGSPWEVPWGELVGHDSYATLRQIYTGYGEDGPSQGSLSSKGVTAKTKEDFPKMDYITSCTILDTRSL